MIRKRAFQHWFFIAFSITTTTILKLPAQEFLGSSHYNYYRTLELIGIAERNVLNYHSLITNTWDINSKTQHPWGEKIIEFDFSTKTNTLITWLPFEQYISYNTKYARGFNDGTSWQGKGINTYLQGGGQISYKGLSATFAPTFWYSQNLSFPLVPSVHESPYGAFIPNIDLPQRFGNDPILQFNWGESEIRYTYSSFTIGFGNQSVWLGPSFLNALILSNNAGGFPKLDIGIKKLHTSLGDLEGFFFLGNLEESEYVDSLIKHRNRWIVGYTLSYAPVFIPGFTIGFHRIALYYDASLNLGNALPIFSEMSTRLGSDEVDQRASLTFEWLLPSVGFKVYGEWARNDFNNSLYSFTRELEHSQAYTIGIAHAFHRTESSIISYQIEITETMHTVDYQTEVILGRGTAGFYTHHIVQHGHTLRGQLLGAAIGPGADSQYLGLNYYGTFGKLTGYILRRSINKDFLYGQPDSIRYHSIKKKQVEASIGLAMDYILNPRITFNFELISSYMISWNYTQNNDIWNFQLITGLRVSLN